RNPKSEIQNCLPLLSFRPCRLRVQQTEIHAILDIQPLQECAEWRHVVCIEACHAFCGDRPKPGFLRVSHNLILQNIHRPDVVPCECRINCWRDSPKIFTDDSCPITMRLEGKDRIQLSRWIIDVDPLVTL